MEKVRNVGGNKKGDKYLSTKKELDILKNVRVTYGTMFKDKPTAIFIQLKTWSDLRDRYTKQELGLIGRKMNKAMRQYVNNVIDRKIFRNDKSILIQEMPTHAMSYGKQTYVAFELTLYQYGNLPLNDRKITSEVLKLVTGLDTFFMKSNTFNFKKDKERYKESL